jgi:hypothetical protein
MFIWMQVWVGSCRLQLEMLAYLSVRQTTEEKEMLDFQRKIESSFTVISDQFVDPAKAKEDLWELHKMGDDTVFKELSILLDPSTSIAHARAASVCFSLSYNSALRGSCSSTKSSPLCHSPIFTQFNTKTHSGKWW